MLRSKLPDISTCLATIVRRIHRENEPWIQERDTYDSFSKQSGKVCLEVWVGHLVVSANGKEG